MPYDKNELRWRTYEFPPQAEADTRPAWDHLMRMALQEFLGTDVKFTTTVRWYDENEKIHAHKLYVLRALLSEELDEDYESSIVWHAQMRRKVDNLVDDEALTCYTATADGQTCRCLVYKTPDRTTVFVRAADQDWWALRANVAWDLFSEDPAIPR